MIIFSLCLFISITLARIQSGGTYKRILTSSDPSFWRQCLEGGDKWCRTTYDRESGTWCTFSSSSFDWTSSYGHNICSDEVFISEKSRVALCPLSDSHWGAHSMILTSLEEVYERENLSLISDSLCNFRITMTNPDANAIKVKISKPSFTNT